MNADDDNPGGPTPAERLGRWSRRKAEVRAGLQPGEDAAETDAPIGRGSAAPVAERRFVPPMVPLAEPEEGEFDYERAPAEALEMLARQREALAAGEAAGEDVEAEEPTVEEQLAALSPEERDAIKDLPPLDSLDKNSDFTPYFGENVPEFLKKAAYRILWLSNPLFNFRDGLNDYDENFRLSEKILSAANGDFKEMPGRQDKPEDKDKPEADAAAGGENAETGSDVGEQAETAPEDAAAADDDDVGDGEDDFEV